MTILGDCSDAPKNAVKNKGFVCAKSPVFGKGACFGDSGGPLMFRGQLAGLVSGGKSCAVGHADAFANVHFYRQWIELQIKTYTTQ